MATIIDNYLTENGNNLTLEDGSGYYVIEGAVAITISSGGHVSSKKSVRKKPHVIFVDQPEPPPPPPPQRKLLRMTPEVRAILAKYRKNQ